eukprot:860338-Prymnesium_polylepis.1
MVRWCAQAGQAGSYSSTINTTTWDAWEKCRGRVLYFFVRFCKDLAKQPNVFNVFTLYRTGIDCGRTGKMRAWGTKEPVCHEVLRAARLGVGMAKRALVMRSKGSQ